MKSGYAFELGPRFYWATAPNDEWETVVYTATGTEVYRGRRLIDGTMCTVWLCDDDKVRAQTEVYAPVPKK